MRSNTSTFDLYLIFAGIVALMLATFYVSHLLTKSEILNRAVQVGAGNYHVNDLGHVRFEWSIEDSTYPLWRRDIELKE